MKDQEKELLNFPEREKVKLWKRSESPGIPDSLVFMRFNGIRKEYDYSGSLDRDKALKLAGQITAGFRSHFYGRVTCVEEPETEHGFKAVKAYLEDGQMIINLPPSANIEGRKPEEGDCILIVFGTEEKPDHHAVCFRDKRFGFELGIDDSNLEFPED